jgi:hypothetical protein
MDMEFLKKFDLTPSKILKIVGLALVAIVILSVSFRLIGSSIRQVVNSGAFDEANRQDFGAYESDSYYYDEVGTGYGGANSVSLSARNVNPSISPSPLPPHDGQGAVGNDAEDFETTQYSASVETRNLARTCGTIIKLKSLEYVIFENANEHDRGCNYTFKVERKYTTDILNVIQDLEPKNLSESTYTIKRTIDDFTSETEILEKKLNTISDTLEDAVRAYDAITNVATNKQDAESLAKIIDSKIGVIERLTRERINISAQLDRLSRSKEDQLDRLLYTYFYIDVYENKFIDSENLKDSWKVAIKNSVRDVNRALQDMTVNMVATLFVLLQYIIYFLVLIITVKFGWRFVKYIWNK